MVIGMTSFTHATIIKSRSIRSCRFASDKDWKLAMVVIFNMQFCFDFVRFIEYIYISILPIKDTATRCKKVSTRHSRSSSIFTKAEKFQEIHFYLFTL